MPGDPLPPDIDTSLGKVQFVKKTDDNLIIPNTVFKLSRKESIDNIATSSAVGGKVLFYNVDAGTSTIEELKSAGDEFKALGTTLSATVVLDHMENSFTITDGGAGVLKGNAAEGYSLISRYKRGIIKLDKVEKDTTNLLSGAEFEVLKNGQQVAYFTESVTTGGSYYLSDRNSTGNVVSAVANERGSNFLSQKEGEWQLLIGDYTIKETKVPEKYAAILDDGNPNINASGSALKTYAVTVTHDREVALTVKNIYAGGEIVGYKYNDATTPAGLSGATIGLFLPNTTTFSALNTYRNITTVSTEEGKFTFTEIPFGTYLLAEILPPKGYQLNQNKIIEVVVTRGATNVTNDSKGEGIFITNAAISNSGGGGGGGSTKPPVTPPVTPPIDSAATPPVTPPTTPPEKTHSGSTFKAYRTQKRRGVYSHQSEGCSSGRNNL